MGHIRHVLIRIDDIGGFDPHRDRIVYALCKAGIRITCAVVPTWLTADCIEFLRRTAADFPGYVEVHQHGYSHENHGDSYEKYEFGPNRSLEQQQRDIAEGRKILEEAFGELFFPAFTPPYNAFDNNTLIALKTSGFCVISSFADHESNCTLPEFSPDVDCFLWAPTQERSWGEIASDWYKDSNKALRGFILHPRLMAPESVILFSSNLPTLLAQDSTVTFAQLLSS